MSVRPAPTGRSKTSNPWQEPEIPMETLQYIHLSGRRLAAIVLVSWIMAALLMP